MILLKLKKYFIKVFFLYSFPIIILFVNFISIKEIKYMNYYNEIKSKLINNEITRKVKKHSINRSD